MKPQPFVPTPEAKFYRYTFAAWFGALLMPAGWCLVATFTWLALTGLALSLNGMNRPPSLAERLMIGGFMLGVVTPFLAFGTKATIRQISQEIVLDRDEVVLRNRLTGRTLRIPFDQIESVEKQPSLEAGAVVVRSALGEIRFTGHLAGFRELTLSLKNAHRKNGPLMPGQ